MDIDEQQLRDDPELLRKVLREWRILHEVIRESPVCFCVYNENDKLISWNQAYENNHPDAFRLHRAEAEAGNLTYRDVVKYDLAKTMPPEDLATALDARVTAQREADGAPVTRFYNTGGHLKVHKYALESGTVAGLAMDVSDLIASQEKLAEAQAETLAQNELLSEMGQQAANEHERLRLATQLAGFGVWEWEIERNAFFLDDQTHVIFGLDPETFDQGTFDVFSLVHPEDSQKVRKTLVGGLKGELSIDIEFRIIRPDGKEGIVRSCGLALTDADGKTMRLIGASVDRTQSYALQNQLAQSQRMEAIGNLTGGLAHDFNNLLAIILGNLELSLMTDDLDATRELTHEAIKATNRGADLTKNLLSFARRAHLTPTRLNLNQLVKTTVNWSARVLPESLNIETSLFDGLWDTELDAASAESALINLLLNARDAMPDGGKLTIKTANTRIDDTDLDDQQENIPAGRYVMLAISDTGCGISPDNIGQIFEPFFTDKPVGQGSGLGLSMVQGFVKQSKGAIRVFSDVGVGTTFKVYLKVAQGTPEPLKPAEPKLEAPLQGGLRILLAEDNADVARVSQNMLESANHIVTLATSGDDALEMFKNAGPFDLLLTDIAMPGTLQGPALAKAVRARSPDFPCIFLSGYAAEATKDGNGLVQGDIRLVKPVQRWELLTKIEQVCRQSKAQNTDRGGD